MCGIFIHECCHGDSFHMTFERALLSFIMPEGKNRGLMQMNLDSPIKSINCLLNLLLKKLVFDCFSLFYF